MSGEFRIVLLALGLLIVLSVYLYSRIEKSKEKAARSVHAHKGRMGDPVIRVPGAVPPDPRNPIESSAADSGSRAAVLDAAADDAEDASRDGERSFVPGAEANTGKARNMGADALNVAKWLSGAIRRMLPDITRPGAWRDKAMNAEMRADADPGGRVLVLHICAPPDRAFHGTEVLAAADKVGLKRGDESGKGAFERVLIDEGGRRLVRYYMANMHEPGTFVWERLPSERVRGLCVLARLSDNDDAVPLFDDMVCCARNVAALLEGASLQDENHGALTSQTINHIREQLRDDVFRNKITRG